MTIQEAAQKVLSEEGRPLPSKEIGKRALERGWVQSGARDPVMSMAQTIEKNIRDIAYNDPPLTFIHVNGRRMIGLMEWKNGEQVEVFSKHRTAPARTELRISFPADLARQLQLAAFADPSWRTETIVVSAVEEWMRAKKDTIRKRVLEQVDQL